MRQCILLLQHQTRVTLFTRENCSLCVTAKAVLHNLKEKRDFDYQEVNVMASNQRRWKQLYEFDTPVVHDLPP